MNGKMTLLFTILAFALLLLFCACDTDEGDDDGDNASPDDDGAPADDDTVAGDDDSSDDDDDDTDPCTDGSRGCLGTQTAVCLDGVLVPFADCHDDGWDCGEGHCTATGHETRVQAEYRKQLDRLRYENFLEPMELDRFGGWVNAPASLGDPQPGNYFRVEKLDGKWWFITPDGNPFVSKGVTDVNWLGATLSEDKWHDIIVDKYGTEDVWADAAQDRMMGWNFNTVGPWSSYSMTLQMTHAIIILDSAGHAPRYPDAIVTDYWSMGFAEWSVTTAEQRATPYVDDQNLIGYFLDNELVWGPDHFATNKTLLWLYMEFPAGSPGRDVAMQFVRDAAGSIATFNATWGVNITDWSELETLSPLTWWPRNGVAQEVTEDFMVTAFHQYAATAIDGLRTVDANHIILGCRFHAYPGDVMVRASADHFDVISMAFYSETPPVSEIDAIYDEVDKPFLVEEWSFKAMDSGLLNIQNYAPVVGTQKARALAYDNYVETFMARPYAVAYHWYKWMDNPWRGISDIFSGDNFGLMNPYDEPYEPFVKFIREVNHRVETWHAEGATDME